ncbi:nuclear transport factor 2 family protein [Maribacter sp. ANRC-HE7]|uniref:histidine kinase n=1 Tax=Maribacter aquimaris TaxID=2737171 RepID=A0ABR7UXF5_9FLAO|nr:ATP-binding protein [Maribacter aquimaris]MBD0776299.1 nuclear transport factor 2 family protein [Maribacter aquimaris]
MKPTKQNQQQVIEVYDKWLYSYLNGDVETYDSYFDNAFHFIGSTNNEEFLNRKGTTDFFRNTAEQFSGKSQLRNETKIVEQFGELVIITHIFDAWFSNGEIWNFYDRFRFSNVLEKNNEGWHFVYQHYSTPDSKAQDGETLGLDKISKENLELREAIQRRTIELEEKNRELEIEGALEHIRAKALAMIVSEDLLDVVVTLRTEFLKLGYEAQYFWHMMWLPDKYEKAMTSGDGTRIGMVMELPRHMHGDIPLLAQWEKSTDPIVIYAMDAEAAIDYVDKMITLGNFQQIDPQAPTHDDIRHIGGLTFVMAKTSHGEIGYSLPGVVENPPKEDLEILVKFADAFDLAHRRFLDIQKAEAQVREAQIETALEKVRSRSLAMQKPDELQEVVAVVAEKLQELGVIFDAGGVILCTYFPDNKDVLHWIAADDFSYSGSYLVPYFENPIFDDAWESKIRGDAYFSKEFSVETKNGFFAYCFEHSDYRDFPDEFKQYALQAEKHHLSAAWSKHSAIIIPSLTGLVPSESNAEILKRFARVFEQAYIRFMDLQVKEEQATALLAEKKRLEDTLSNLQTTQKQLIQAEKMASLGELTAGIAHEIQNPLNFVNNFSEVSNELIDEMNEEIEKGDLEEVKFIAKDIKQNLEKINHHGKRADAIVKGMLQHSRKSTAEKEPTDINKLADEYLRLAYHGLRAKDKSFNAELVTDFDEHIEKVNMIPQDMGRVILNLITNAFYAVNEKKQQKPKVYKPAVTVSTKRVGDKIEIKVTDNGNGIPKHVIDKVFQPFFTTKPTGQGTGLGLSMSYDIIKKGHGGELKVDTQEGEGTEFRIILPVNSLLDG